MKDKKGFTLVELLGVIVIISIISGIAAIAITRVIKNAKKETYSAVEKNLQTATEEYLTDNPALIPVTSTPVTVTLNTLVTNDYLASIKDPDKRGAYCDQTLSTIVATRDITNLENIELSYKVCLICAKYRSNGCD